MIRLTQLMWCAIAAYVSAGCAVSYNDLVHQDDSPSLATLLEEPEAPLVTRWPTTRAGHAIDVAVHELGHPAAPCVLVFIHGGAATARSWRFVTTDLGVDHRLLLVDLPGYGESGAPHPRDLPCDEYTPDAMADRVLQAVAQHLEATPPSSITFVSHSLGGTATLRMFGDADIRKRHAELLDRVERLVLLAPMDVDFVNPPAALVALAQINRTVVDLGLLTGIVRERVARGIADSVHDPQLALVEDCDARCAMIADRERFPALQATLRRALPITDDESLDYAAVERITAEYANVDVPCLILWGAYDEILPLSMGYKLGWQLPRAALFVVPSCKHSPHLEHPTMCADAVRRFAAAADPLSVDLTDLGFRRPDAASSTRSDVQ